MISEAAAKLVSARDHEPPATPVVEPSRPETRHRWQDDWWNPTSGPSEVAKEVFLGKDSWLLAWHLHVRSGRPLAVFEERQPGARNQMWHQVHPVLVIGNGQYLDIAGKQSKDQLAQNHSSGRRVRNRMSDLPKGIDFSRYQRIMSDEPITWRSTSDVADYLARELLVAAGVTN